MSMISRKFLSLAFSHRSALMAKRSPFRYSDWPPEPWTHTQIYDRHQHIRYTLYGARGGQYSLPTVDKLLQRAITEMRSPFNHDMEEKTTRRYCVAATETTSKLCLSVRPLLNQSKKWAINAILSYHNYSLRYGPQAAEFQVWRQDEKGRNLHMVNIVLSGDFDDYPGSRFYPHIPTKLAHKS